MTRKIILVTGASAGIGYACAARLAQGGSRIYAASRRGTAAPGCEPLVMDVNDDASVTAGIEKTLAANGRIDALVHCAGWGLAGAVEDTSTAEAKAQFETNFFGAHRLCRAVLPVMRKQGGGRIVLISSLAAYIPLPYQAFYSASKAALSNFAEALHLELRPHGIRVVCIEPGNFRTDFTGSRRRAAAWTPASTYAARSGASIAWMEKDEQNAPEPDAVVRRIVQAVQSDSIPLHQKVAIPFERLGVVLRMLLPWRVYEIIAARLFRAD